MNVLPFPSRPPAPRTCFECEHLGTLRNGGSHCLMFDEPIDSEIHAAKDCHAFEPAVD